jgi:DNA-binding NarL/FixJ family response regulator
VPETAARPSILRRLFSPTSLMDLQMPVLNGIEATREVRRAAPGCRVVIVTALASADDESRAREAGARVYVRKGGFTAELFDAIFNAASESLGARETQLREMTPVPPPAPRSRRLAPLTIRALRAFR